MGRLVPDGDIQGLGDGPHVRFRQSGLHHRAANPVLGRCYHAGTVVSLVVGVGAVDHPLDGLRVGQLGELGVKLGLAEVAPLGGVGNVAFLVHLVGVDDAVGEPHSLSQTDCFFQFSFGQRWGSRSHGLGLWTEHPVGRNRDQRAINAPRESDNHRAHIPKDSL